MKQINTRSYYIAQGTVLWQTTVQKNVKKYMCVCVCVCVYKLNHFVVYQKLAKHCKSTILQYRIYSAKPFFPPLHSVYLCVLPTRKTNAYFEKLQNICLPSDCPLPVFPLVFTICLGFWPCFVGVSVCVYASFYFTVFYFLGRSNI